MAIAVFAIFILQKKHLLNKVSNHLVIEMTNQSTNILYNSRKKKVTSRKGSRKREGKIRIYDPQQVAEIIRNNPKKKIRKEANNVKSAMQKNGEILIEGQIPNEFIFPSK